MTDTDVPAIALIHFAARSAFEVDVTVGVLREAEVGTDTVFNPEAAEVVLQVAAGRGILSGHLQVAEEVVVAGHAGIDTALVFSELRAGADTDAGDERVVVALVNLSSLLNVSSTGTPFFSNPLIF